MRMLKFAFNLIDDGLVGQQVFAGEATRLAYVTDEAAEGRDAFLEKRPRLVPVPPASGSVCTRRNTIQEVPRLVAADRRAD